MKRIKYSNSENKSNHGCLRLNFTYECSDKRYYKGWRLLKEVIHPDSEIRIISKQIRSSENRGYNAVNASYDNNAPPPNAEGGIGARAVAGDNRPQAILPRNLSPHWVTPTVHPSSA